jgi:hypothetical protein
MRPFLNVGPLFATNRPVRIQDGTTIRRGFATIAVQAVEVHPELRKGYVAAFELFLTKVNGKPLIANDQFQRQV